MRLVLFDVDGTLADSFGLICEVMRRTFSGEGLPEPGDAATCAIIGLSLDRAMLALYPTCPESQIVALVESYRRNFWAIREDPLYREQLFSGIRAMIDDLRARDDVLLGMVTGKTRRGVNAAVETHGLEGIFLASRTADDCPSKPHPAMVLECCAELGVDASDTLVIGDALYDIEMARSAGATAIGVAWGAGTPEPLMNAGALAVAGDVAALRRMIDQWLESQAVEGGAEAAIDMPA